MRVQTIYNREVLESTVTFDMVPRTLDEQRDWIAEHSGAHPALVAVEGDGTIVGFGSLTAYRPRRRTHRPSRIRCTCITSTGGAATAGLILEDLVRRGSDHGFHTVIARIVGHHDASISLHARCGFEHTGTEREVGRKFNRWLDVVLMQRML